MAPSLSGQENSWETSMGEGLQVGFLQSGKFSVFVSPPHTQGRAGSLSRPSRLKHKSELALPRIWAGDLPRLAQVLQETEAETEKGGQEA